MKEKLDDKLNKLEDLLLDILSKLVEQNKAEVNIEKKYLSAEEAANYLNLSLNTLYRHTMNRTIKFYKINRKLYFVREDLDEFVTGKSKLIDIPTQHSIEKVTSKGEPDYLSVDEAAQFLKVSQGSIYRYVFNGVLPKRKFGNKLYFPKSLLIDLIEKG